MNKCNFHNKITKIKNNIYYIYIYISIIYILFYVHHKPFGALNPEEFFLNMWWQKPITIGGRRVFESTKSEWIADLAE